jgi:HEAT repeat protein
VVAARDHEALLALARAKDTGDRRRWVAVRALGPMHTAESRGGLVTLLAAPDALTRMAACGALADNGDGRVAGRVAVRLTDKALLVRVAAARALGQLRDVGTLPDLSRALTDPANRHPGVAGWMRVVFVEAIVAIGTTEAAPHLARLLEDSDPLVGEAARKGLETIAGFSYGEGRSPAEELAAWKRWAGVP